MNYKIIDMEKYYRKGVFEHFSKDCKCRISMTVKLDVTKLVEYSKETKTKIYLNFLYLLCKTLNSKDDYKMYYEYHLNELRCYDTINPIQYVFFEESKTCKPVYSTYYEDYNTFYTNALKDIEEAKKDPTYKLESSTHPNWFDASFMPWVSYDSFSVECPDGYLYFPPIVNWGKYYLENNRIMMPVTCGLNHAIADGYLMSNIFVTLAKEIETFTK